MLEKKQDTELPCAGVHGADMGIKLFISFVCVCYFPGYCKQLAIDHV